MFYWDSELHFFEENGGRKNRIILQKSGSQTASMRLIGVFVHEGNFAADVVNHEAMQRKAWYEQGQGTYAPTADSLGILFILHT
jgi:hypothetical protein